jgi:cell wall-associated NlpC family hydrolase
MTFSLIGCCTVLAFLVGCASVSVASSPGDRASTDAASRAADVALTMTGRPYRHGGSTPAGFDCSGLVHYSYARVGVQLSRDTRGLREQTGEIARTELRPGDLVFFDQDGKKFSHVGIYLGEGRFVHAPSSGGKVRTDDLQSDYWTRHFVEARRI